MNIAEILTANYLGTEWALTGTEYSGLEWLDKTTPKPTEEELLSQWPEVQYAVEYNAVLQTRQQQYAAISDPIFMQYQRGEVDKQVWLDAVQQIKEANPYPVKGK